MSLTPGTRLGVYEITAHIGDGGMGQVFRATDTSLGRQIAIKILPEAFASDPDRLSRFEREAKTLASLNHQHIAAIYAIEHSGPVRALVMELVEGEDLSERLARGRLPLDEALQIAKQVAEALEAAHEQGIIHRDLKPANIKLRPDGVVKVLDFGLAKAIEPAGEAGVRDATNSPTITSPAHMTRIGMVLGTAAYMSPEQAKGRPADKRSDIFSFGVVLYEMLTGRRAFDGEDVSETMAGVLRADLDWSALPPETPVTVVAYLKRCVTKDPAQRIRDIGDVRLALEGAFETATVSVAQTTTPPRSFSRERLLWASGAIVLAAMLGAGAYFTRPARVSVPETRLQMDRPSGPNALFAVSPDGRMVAFRSSETSGRTQVWLRRLDNETPEVLPGLEDALGFFWSPDSREIGYVAAGQLKRMALADGRVQTITNSQNTAGGAWSADGTILFTRGWNGPVFRVPAGGGEATPLTRVDSPQQGGHAWPQFLPDGRHFLFFAFGTADGMGIYLGSLDDPDRATRLLQNDTAAAFLPPDQLLYAREGALVAQRLDLPRAQLVGEAVTVAPRVVVDASNARSLMSTSASGTVAYRSRPAELQMAWFDRSGQRIGTIGDPYTDLDLGSRPALSPDGRILALTRQGRDPDIWLMDVTRGSRRRLTVAPSSEVSPVWSPDGRRLVFGSDRRGGVLDLYLQDADGAGAESLLLESPENKIATDWSKDGRYILYENFTKTRTALDLWALPLDGDRKAFPVVTNTGGDWGGQFSPDGKWITYHSSESGRLEVYVQSFPAPTRRIQISTDGGQGAQWRADGRELFYTGLDDRVISVAIGIDRTPVEVGPPVVIFTKPAGSMVARHEPQRFMLAATAQEASPITLLLNWAGPTGAR